MLRLRVDDYHTAIAAFERSVALNPYNVITYLQLAQAKMRLAQAALVRDGLDDLDTPLQALEGAMVDAGKALDLAPAYAPASETLGRAAALSATALKKVGGAGGAQRLLPLWEAAQARLLEAIKHGARNQSELYRLLSRIETERGDLDAAEEMLVRAAQTDSSGLQTWKTFLDFAYEHERHDRARNALYDQLSRLKDADKPDRDAIATANLWLANLLENGYGNFEAADRTYRNAVEAGPERLDVWTNLARYAYKHQRQDLLYTALAESCDRLSAQGKEPLPHVKAANAVLQRGAKALEQASVALMAQVRAYPRNKALSAAQAFGWTAQVLLEALEPQAGLTQDQCQIYLNLGITFSGIGNATESGRRDLAVADQIFSKAAGCFEGAWKMTHAKHWASVLVQLNRHHEALGLLRSALKETPDDMDGRHALAMTLVQVGDFEEARKVYEALLEVPGLTPKARTMFEQELAAF